jgi:hypothetical protein
VFNRFSSKFFRCKKISLFGLFEQRPVWSTLSAKFLVMLNTTVSAFHNRLKVPSHRCPMLRRLFCLLYALFRGYVNFLSRRHHDHARSRRFPDFFSYSPTHNSAAIRSSGKRLSRCNLNLLLCDDGKTVFMHAATRMGQGGPSILRWEEHILITT